MTKISRILKDYQESGAMGALVNIHAAVDEPLFLTKSGELVAVLAMRGPDYECLDPAELDAVTRRFLSALRLFDENFRLYQYMLKSESAEFPCRSYANPIVQEAVRSRVAYLQAKSATLYSLDTYLAVVYSGWRPARNYRENLSRLVAEPGACLREMFSSRRQVTVLESDLARAQEILRNKVASFAIQLRDFIDLDLLDHQRAFSFLRRLLNYAPYKRQAARLRPDMFVDFQACDSGLECHRDHLRLDDYYVAVLTLKGPPAQTFANLAKSLMEIPANYILASEWNRENPAKTRQLIQSKRRHFHNSKASLLNYVTPSDQGAPKDLLIDDGALGQVRDLGACLEELEVNGRHFGEFAATVVLYHLDLSALKRSVAECIKAFSAVDASLIEERYNQLNAWSAVLPGNHAYNLRRMRLMDTNFADFSFLFSQAKGDALNPQLGAEYLAILETNTGTPFYFNLHCQDVAHTLILGATGSGKSFLLNFLVTHLQKYDPFTYIFDLGGSYETLTRLFDGRYVRIGAQEHSLAINPFSLPPTPENLNFLFAFVKVLIESGGYAMTAPDEHDLYEQIENLYAIAPEQRRLLTLSNILKRGLQVHLQKWVRDGHSGGGGHTEGGQYGTWFDNVTDNLTFSRFQAFDLEGMDKVPALLEPLLFYILHRANAVIYDPEQATTFKAFVMDEAWRFLRHPTIGLYILEALKTWRKKNAAMILATQSTDDLFQSETLRVVVESCPTKLFLANPNIDRAAYRDLFHLNETEAAWIARLLPKRQMLLKRPDLAKVLNLNVDRKGYWLYTNDPQGNRKKREAFERHGFREGLESLAKENPAS